MRTQSVDTHPEAERIMIELIRSAPMSKRFRLVPSLTHSAFWATVHAWQERHHEASEQEAAVHVLSYFSGPGLAQRVQAALEKRECWQLQPIDLLVVRLRKRAGITSKGISPSLLRESFALRYLQAGGEPHLLQELLGYADQATSTRYQYLSTQLLARRQPKEAFGDYLPQHRPGLTNDQQGEDAAARPLWKKTRLTQPSSAGVIGVQNSRGDMVSNQPGQVECPTKDHREREEVGLHRDVMELVDP